MNKNCRR